MLRHWVGHTRCLSYLVCAELAAEREEPHEGSSLRGLCNRKSSAGRSPDRPAREWLPACHSEQHARKTAATQSLTRDRIPAKCLEARITCLLGDQVSKLASSWLSDAQVRSGLAASLDTLFSRVQVEGERRRAPPGFLHPWIEWMISRGNFAPSVCPEWSSFSTFRGPQASRPLEGPVSEIREWHCHIRFPSLWQSGWAIMKCVVLLLCVLLAGSASAARPAAETHTEVITLNESRCQACTDLLSLLQTRLQDPTMQQQLMQYVIQDVCPQLPQADRTQCSLFAPLVIASAVGWVRGQSPIAICTRVSLCPATVRGFWKLNRLTSLFRLLWQQCCLD